MNTSTNKTKNMFKKFATLFLIGMMAIGFQACKKIKDLVKIEVPATMEVDFTIPPVPVTGVTGFGVYNVAMDVDELIRSANKELDADNIESARIVSCIVTAQPNTTHPEDNFTAFSSLLAEFASNTKTDWVTIAQLTNPPTDGYSMELPVNSDAELKDYLKGSVFMYRVSGMAVRTTASAIKCKAKIKFMIKAGLN